MYREIARLRTRPGAKTLAHPREACHDGRMAKTKTTPRKTPARATSQAQGAATLAPILPLTAAHKDITRNAQRFLIATAAPIIKGARLALTTGESMLAYFTSLASWAEENRLQYAGATAPATRTTGSGIKTRRAGA